MAEAEAKAQGTTDVSGNLVQYRVQDGVAILTLNDPPANTYSYEMMQELDRSILAARMDESVQVIVITGQGEKFFCAGANIQMLSSVTPEFKYYFCLHANETLSRLEDRKSTRLNSSHVSISYAVFCLKKKKNTTIKIITRSITYLIDSTSEFS